MKNILTQKNGNTAFPPIAALMRQGGLPSELSDEYLDRKFNRPARQKEQVEYEPTRDLGLLHQYYRLREQMFINLWGLKNFSGKKDLFDDRSDTVVARIGNHCIGGSRLTFTTPNVRLPLPMEGEDFALMDALPELPLSDVPYCEVSRLAILPDYQNSLVMLELSRQMLQVAAEKRARYAFSLAPLPLARSYRQTMNLFGLQWVLRPDVHIPAREEYEGIRMMLSVMDLTPIYKQLPMASEETKAEIRSQITA